MTTSLRPSSVCRYVILILLPSMVLFVRPLSGQEQGRFRIMFYNVENLFDTSNDSLVKDEEFLPEGDKHWDADKYYKKLNNIYKVIISCGEWDPPAVVGLCEVENRGVLKDLVGDTPLDKFGYRIVHFDSPDERGIDVAMLYRWDLFSPDTAYPLPVTFPGDPEDHTRDILIVKGTLGGAGTIHFFINHWPSRSGGYEASKPKRNRAAEVLRQAVDSVLKQDAQAGIVIMGDFNDGPLDESLKDHLLAATDEGSADTAALINLMAPFAGIPGVGTLKFRENWDVFDQLIVSSGLLDGSGPLRVDPEGAHIHNPSFLTENDERYLGVRPFRTYAGPRYLGGYSDHFPVFLDLIAH